MNRRIFHFSLGVLAVGLAVSGGDSRGQFGPEKYGIGATLIRADTTSPVIIRSCVPGGPADRAGLLPGDRISELDGLSVQAWSFDEVIGYLIREAPTPLRITVLRESAALSVELVRARFSDIAAGSGFRWVSSRDSLDYRIVPLEEKDPLEVGSVLEPVGLRNAHCEDVELPLSGRGETLLYFWASWCGPCKVLMRELVDSQRQIARSGVRLVGVNVDRSCEVFEAVNDTLRPPGEQYWMGGYYGDLAQVLRVYRRGIPTGALFDQRGHLLKVETGVYNVLSLLDNVGPGGER